MEDASEFLAQVKQMLAWRAELGMTATQHIRSFVSQIVVLDFYEYCLGCFVDVVK